MAGSVIRVAAIGIYMQGTTRTVRICSSDGSPSTAKWPVGVAPFAAGLISLKPGDPAVDACCDELHATLEAHGISVLLRIRSDAEAGGVRLVLVAEHRAVLHPMHVTGASDHFALHPTVTAVG